MLSLIFFATVALIVNAGHSFGRIAVCIPVVLMAFMSYWSEPYLHGLHYYVVSGTLSAIVIALLLIPRQTQLNLHIQVINLFAIFAHGIGATLAYNELSLSIYSDIILVLGVIEFTRLISVTKMDKKEYGLAGGFDFIGKLIRFRKLGGHR